jgi:HlyD family secretion protein
MPLLQQQLTTAPASSHATHGSDAASIARVIEPLRKGRRWRLARILFVVAALVAIAAAGYVFSRPRGAGPQYVSVAARRGDLQARVVATGTLQALDQVQVGAEVSGRVLRVNVDFNDRVRSGQVLCQLDPEQWRAAVKQATAQLSANEAALARSRAAKQEVDLALDRTRLLVPEGLATRQALEAATSAALRAQAEVELALAQVAVADAALQSALTSLEKTTIRAPMDGIVLSRAVEPGQTVAATLAAPVLFVLARDLAQMELRINVDEADIGQVGPGQAASFSVDTYPGRRFPARLSSIHNIATTQNNVVTYEARLQVDNSDLALRPGMTATVDIITAERRGVLLVPNAALRFTPPALIESSRGGPVPIFGRRAPAPRATTAVPTGPRVWVRGEAGPVARQIQPGMTDGEWTEVTGGDIQEGDDVLTDIVANGT